MKITSYVAGAAILMATGIPVRLLAQDCTAPAVIAADRPGYLTGPFLSTPGSPQLESGWSLSHRTEQTALTVGSSLLRIPQSCFLELRFGLGGLVLSRATPGAMTVAAADAYVGTKVRLRQGAGLHPHLALLAGTTIPVGGLASHGVAEPDAALSALWDLGRGATLLAYTGLAARAGVNGRETERLAGLSGGMPLSARAAAFIEFAEFDRAGARSHAATLGLQFFPEAGWQLDGFVSSPLKRLGEVDLGIGVARRW